MSLIIGTAGHIDHGKTALIKELNGFEGDRLEEEQKRGITIDLSFSNLSKNGENIAFIDVPGHENLIKTMISGAYGFDACLFVVAANDGLMPQSLEHLEVLNILGVRSLVVALTKCDLAGAELIEQRKGEIYAAAQKYKNLQILEIFPVSIKDSVSIDELRNYLFTLKAASREQEGVFRYYIDRVFSLKGIGNVVTGTVIEGSVSKNEKLFNCDAGKEVQVRSVQSHDKFVDRAGVSSRVALNLTGIELKKGETLPDRPIMVSTDNDSYLSRPQAGISKADILYEVPIEGGGSRYEPIYYGKIDELTTMGAVRSVRPYILDIARELKEIGYKEDLAFFLSKYYKGEIIK